MKRLLILAAVGETATGVALLVVPSLVGQLLLGAELTGIAMVVARVAGIALIALGVACLLARDDGGSPAQHGLLCGMLVYNTAACGVLGYAGTMLHMAGVLLWPAVLLHMAMAVWCLRCLGPLPGRK